MNTIVRKLGFVVAMISCFGSCGPQPEKVTEDREKSAGSGYSKYPMRDFKHLKINCDYGRLDVKVYQYTKPYVEVHETYRKYVSFEERGDSLIIYTVKTPKSTEENPVKKRIRIYVPDLDSYSSEVSTTTFMNFRTQNMNVDLANDYFRIYNCGFEKLQVTTKDACHVVIDNQNIVLSAFIKINEDSRITCEAAIGEFVLTKKTLDNVKITENSAANLKWVKK